jgi:hypothetical protein
MKNHQANERKGKKYLVTFIAITALNLILGAFLIHKSSGQTNKHADQKPLMVEVTAQNDNPLRIMLIDIDNSALSTQKVNYTMFNETGGSGGLRNLYGRVRGTLRTC